MQDITYKTDAICVFCGAQNAVPKEHLEMARQLGVDMAAGGKKLVYGGGDCGLMGAVANGVLEGQGEAIGVFPRSLGRIEVEHRGLSNMIMVDSMHERKQIMYDHADVFVVLPGGFGTLDEMFEVITWRQIKIHEKLVIIYNHNGYWDHMITLMEHMIAQGFARPETRQFYTVANTKEELYALLGLK
ncbi:MAG: TIGR00730 family Rossman fold protein [Pseudomonadota bacterium]